jgi:hypothetical protein
MLRLVHSRGPPGIIRLLPPPPHVITVDPPGGHTQANDDPNDDSNDDFNDDPEEGEITEGSEYESNQEIEEAGAEWSERGEGHGEGDTPVGSGGNSTEGENGYVSDDSYEALPDDDPSEFDMWADIQRHVQRTRNNQESPDDQGD